MFVGLQALGLSDQVWLDGSCIQSLLELRFFERDAGKLLLERHNRLIEFGEALFEFAYLSRRLPAVGR